MKLAPVDSSQITHIGHDPESSRMVVKFKSGQLYAYDNVTPEQHEALIGAKSIGSHFHTNFKSQPSAFPYSKYDGQVEFEGEQP